MFECSGIFGSLAGAIEDFFLKLPVFYGVLIACMIGYFAWQSYRWKLRA